LSLPLNPLPTPPKAIARGFLVLFHIGIWSPSTIYHHLNLLPSPSPFPLLPLHTYTEPFQFWFSLLTFKLMFKGVSQCMPSVGMLYLGLFSPFKYSPLSLCLLLSIFQQFSVHILISSTFTSYGMWYYWYSITLFSFPSFPKFHRVVPLLQTSSTFEFVYDHACFYMYIYLWICLPHMRENMHLLCFWSWLTSLTMISFASIYCQITYHYSLGWVVLPCIYVPQFHNPFISCRASGLFLELGYCE
jgi:hypothetical protein